ncbi:hypothetical protein KUCAC02_018214, partial [Chaenocephalus aceratus]
RLRRLLVCMCSETRVTQLCALDENTWLIESLTVRPPSQAKCLEKASMMNLSKSSPPGSIFEKVEFNLRINSAKQSERPERCEVALNLETLWTLDTPPSPSTPTLPAQPRAARLPASHTSLLST